jgi:hypothetical protein
MYPSFHKTIDPRAVEPGPIPAQTSEKGKLYFHKNACANLHVLGQPNTFLATVLQGDDGQVSKLHMRYAQNGGLKIVGNRNVVSEALLEDMTWLASLDFPPLEIGFGFANPTTTAAAAWPEAEGDGEDIARSAWGGLDLGGVDPTLGNDNIVTRSTLRRFGEMGLVTSQVRKAPSWSRSWANFNHLQLYSHRNAWANLHVLGQPNTFLATALE